MMGLSRQQILATLVTAAVLLAGGYTLVRGRIIEPLRQRQATLAEMQERESLLRGRIARHIPVATSWQEVTRRTLAGSTFEAHQTFRNDVQRLLEESGLGKIVLRARDPKIQSKGLREGFAELELLVNAEGNLEQIVNFVKAFYQRPYYGRVVRFSLRVTSTPKAAAAEQAAPPAPPEEPAKPTGAGSAAARRRARNNANAAAQPKPAAVPAQAPRSAAHVEEPRLAVTMTLATLALPAVKDVPPAPVLAEMLLDPAALEERAAKVLAQPDLSAYDAIAQVNVFKLYQPPPPPPPVVVQNVEPEPTPVVEQPTPEVEPPPPPPAPDFSQHFVLRSTESNDGDLVAYIVDDRDPTSPPQQKRLNEDFHDGRLVVIHPLGVVVRSPPDPAKQRPGETDYFYPLGTRFTEREPLDPAKYPDVARDLARAFVRG